MVDLFIYLSFQSVFYDWCIKGHGMCNPVYGMGHIKEPLLLTGKSSPYSNGSESRLSLGSKYTNKTMFLLKAMMW